MKAPTILISATDKEEPLQLNRAGCGTSVKVKIFPRERSVREDFDFYI